MRVLRILFRCIMVNLRRAELAADVLLYISADFLDSHVSQTHGVRSHIGNQTDRALAQRNAFIKLLRQHHRFLGREVQLFVGLLLQAGRCERRYRVALALLAYCLLHDVVSLAQSSLCCACFLYVVQLELLALILHGLCFKNRCLSILAQLGAQRPVFHRLERFNLAVTVSNNLRRYRLHAACTQALADFTPQQRAELIAYDAVENTACLLCVDHIHINGTRMLDSVLDSSAGNLMKFNTALVLRRNAQNMTKMPADCFALAVRVSCQINFIRFFSQGLELLNQLALAADVDILGFKVVLYVDTEGALRQVTQMSHRSSYRKILA